MKPMELYLVDIGGGDTKRRPALLMKWNESKAFIFRITSQYEKKYIHIKEMYYSIIDWKEAGLNMKSYIDTVRLYDLDINIVTKKDPIGMLSKRDRIGLMDFLNKMNKD